MSSIGKLTSYLIRFSLGITAITLGLFQSSAAHRAFAAVGQLEIQAVDTGAYEGDSTVTVRVANTGQGTIQDIRISCDGLPGVTAKVEPETLPLLPEYSSTFVTVHVQGQPEHRPAKLVVKAQGRTETGETVALATIDLLESAAVAKMTLTGSTTMTESSPAFVSVIVDNSSDSPISVALRAEAAENDVRLAPEGDDVGRAVVGAPVDLTVPGHQSAVVSVQVESRPPVRRGTVGLIISATIREKGSAASFTIVASRDLTVTLSTDALPGAIGIGSILLLPGLLAVWAFLAVLQWDRRRIGVKTTSVSAIMWQDKLWLVAALAVSLLAAAIYSALGFLNLFDTYTMQDVVKVGAACGMVGAGAAALVVLAHRRRIKAINRDSSALDVIEAAAKFDGNTVSRETYRTPGGELGILVHEDRGELVLTPPIFCNSSLPDGYKTRLQMVVEMTQEKPEKERDLHFDRQTGTISRPTAVDGNATPVGTQEIIKYKAAVGAGDA